MDSLTTSRFGAYLLTRHVHSASLLCMALGVAENTAESSLPVGRGYDLTQRTRSNVASAVLEIVLFYWIFC